MLPRLPFGLRHLRSLFTANDTPHQLALGFALGMALGLIPKGNLIAAMLMLVLLGTRVNLAAGLLASLLFSWVGYVVDPWTDRIGLAVLSTVWLKPLWRLLATLPLVPWTCFNNTLVMGNVILSVLLFYPTYRLALPVMTRWRRRLEQRREWVPGGASRTAMVTDTPRPQPWDRSGDRKLRIVLPGDADRTATISESAQSPPPAAAPAAPSPSVVPQPYHRRVG